MTRSESESLFDDMNLSCGSEHTQICKVSETFDSVLLVQELLRETDFTQIMFNNYFMSIYTHTHIRIISVRFPTDFSIGRRVKSR